MSWRNMISQCFGCQDKKFALHPSDEQAAKSMIKAAKNSGASLADVEKEIVYFCYKNINSEDLLKQHIDDQLKKLKELYS
ncbi:MAG: hypothetical protein IAE63_07880 [Alphaproteobacteria bacterium]|nr:hypothetical protein [Alphaproteobacteria bacterium]